MQRMIITVTDEMFRRLNIEKKKKGISDSVLINEKIVKANEADERFLELEKQAVKKTNEE